MAGTAMVLGGAAPWLNLFFVQAPTISGLMLPVSLAPFGAVLAGACVAGCLRLDPLEQVAVRRTGWRGVLVALCVIGAGSHALAVPAGIAGWRTLILVVGLALLGKVVASARLVGIGLVAYLLVACTFRTPMADDPLAAPWWAGIVDGSDSPGVWVMAVLVAVLGAALQLRLSGVPTAHPAGGPV